MPNDLPLETRELRQRLAQFFDMEIEDPIQQIPVKLGNYKFGVYAFFDYDGEPIYVGQTRESLRVRIRRHLTNQRTDAVAMNVLDPFEVHTIRVWPLPQFERQSGNYPEARKTLDALEYTVFHELLQASEFNAVLNEKEPLQPKTKIKVPANFEGQIVSPDVERIRAHADIRIARRALTLSKLAQVISERQVQKGLRKTLVTQANRLASLAKKRYQDTLSDPSTDEDEEI